MSDPGSIERAELERRYREACELLLAAQAEIARIADDLAGTSRVRDEAVLELATVRDELASALGELDHAGRTRALREQQLDEVLGSASWQLTGPLRRIKALVRESRQ